MSGCGLHPAGMPAQRHKVAIVTGASRGIGMRCDGARADEHLLFEAWIAARNTHAAGAASSSAPEATPTAAQRERNPS
jgi:NAD(P)-dependent dehydrogenase (short-subunit alcohol dehydrogenase family)